MMNWTYRPATTFGLGFLSLAMASPAEAAWSAYKTIGPDIVLETPACAADGTGTAICAAIGSGNAMLVARYNGSNWSGWTRLASAVASGASCATVRTSQVVCAARDTNLNLAAFLWNGSAWKGPITPLAALASAPSCAALVAGQVLCAGTSTDGVLISAVYNGDGWSLSSWTKPKPLTDTMYSSPNCASDEAGSAVCAYLSKTATTTVRRYQAAWSGAVNIGGMASQPPACTDNGVSGEVGCFATGTNSALFGQTFSGGGFMASHWSGYGSLGGVVNSYSCTQNSQKAALQGYVCGVRGTVDDAFYSDLFESGSWAGYVSHGGAFISGPACFPINRTAKPGLDMCVLVTAAHLAQSITGP